MGLRTIHLPARRRTQQKQLAAAPYVPPCLSVRRSGLFLIDGLHANDLPYPHRIHCEIDPKVPRVISDNSSRGVFLKIAAMFRYRATSRFERLKVLRVLKQRRGSA